MKNISVRDKACLAVTTLCGIGYTPLCPGTASCVVAVVVFIFVKDQFLFGVVTACSLLFAFALSGRAEKIIGKKDARPIVIDDFSGQLITYLFIPHDVRFLICGFFLFRMLDMLKIPPADKIEKYPGAMGVVGDDVIAGVYANFALQVVRVVLNALGAGS